MHYVFNDYFKTTGVMNIMQTVVISAVAMLLSGCLNIEDARWRRYIPNARCYLYIDSDFN